MSVLTVRYIPNFQAIQDLDKTETGVDGVSSLNLEDDRDNERKLREEQLIATMEDQVSSNLAGGNTSDSSDRSVESSPSRQKDSNYATSQQQRGQPRKRSESLPPPSHQARPTPPNNKNSLLPSLSSLLNPPEPSR